jgi:hypothetical protein
MVPLRTDPRSADSNDMTTERNRRRIPGPGALLLAAVIVLALSPAALAGPKLAVTVKTHGTCTASSSWTLKVQAATNAPLVVKFMVKGASAGQKWNIFMSDNGTGVFVGSRVTNSDGAFVVSHRVKNRLGVDTITIGANTAATGETCGARAAI